jgi:hypothetical protein
VIGLETESHRDPGIAQIKEISVPKSEISTGQATVLDPNSIGHVDPDPESRSRRQKLTSKRERDVKKFYVLKSGCSIFGGLEASPVA